MIGSFDGSFATGTEAQQWIFNRSLFETTITHWELVIYKLCAGDLVT
jgi:hypothetical protein